MARALTKRQAEILEMIKDFMRQHNMPPTVLEIAEAFGFKSSSCFDHLKALERKGYIRRSSKARSIQLTEFVGGRVSLRQAVEVPVIGKVTAGRPILAVENIEGTVALDEQWVSSDTFILRVEGDSMTGAGIMDGDLVLVRQQPSVEEGEIAVCLLGEEATVKRVFREGGRVRLQPENPDFEPIFVDRSDADFKILGKVVGLYRRL